MIVKCDEFERLIDFLEYALNMKLKLYQKEYLRLIWLRRV